MKRKATPKPKPSQPTEEERLFGTREAAEYLGISISGVKHHLYRTGKLRGEKKGNGLIFRQSSLDTLKPKLGRHPKVATAHA